jgi:hypothetical protein
MQKRASMKLTDNLLRRLPTPERGNKITWDDALKGFGGREEAKRLKRNIDGGGDRSVMVRGAACRRQT